MIHRLLRYQIKNGISGLLGVFCFQTTFVNPEGLDDAPAGWRVTMLVSCFKFRTRFDGDS